MCSHLYVSNGYCTSCGLLIEETADLQQCNEYTSYHKQNNLNNSTCKRYTKSLNMLLNYFNIYHYKSNIEKEFSEKKFKSKLSIKDKLLLIIYNILRLEDYPITFSDLSRFTSDVKSKWFKEYKYIPYTKGYIQNVTCRYTDDIFNVNEICELAEIFNRYQIEMVIVGYIKVKGLRMKEEGEVFVNIKLIEKINDKLKDNIV